MTADRRTPPEPSSSPTPAARLRGLAAIPLRGIFASSADRSRISLLGLLGGFLLAAVWLAPSLVGRTVFFPAELWRVSVPFSLSGSEARSYPAPNPLRTDRAFLFGPHAAFVNRELRAGEVPLWNRFVRAGEPVLQNGDSLPLHPLNLPVALLPWPLGFAWAAWLRIGLTWMGGWLFGRALGLGRGFAGALAVGFTLAPGCIANFEQPRVLAHVGLPWLLLGVERLAAAAARGPLAQLRAALPLAAVELLVAANGYPPAAFNVSFAAALYLLVRLPLRPLRVGASLRAAGLAALALGCALAAPLLLPTLEFLRASVTFAERQGAGAWTLPAETLRLLADPFALGSPIQNGAPRWTGVYNFEEQQQYVGLLPWAFLVAALPLLGSRWRRAPADAARVVALASVVFVCASLAFGWPPLHGLLSALPPFSYNSNPRLAFVAQPLLLPLVALLCRGWLGAWPAPRAARALLLAAGAGVAATLVLGVARSWSLRPAVVLAACAALFAAGALAASRPQRRLASALLPLLLLADLAPIYRGYYRQPPREWAEPADGIRRLPAPLRAEAQPRVAFESFTPPNLPSVLAMEDVRAYGFPVPDRYDAFMREVLEVENPETLSRADLERAQVLAGLERTCAGWLFTSAQYEAAAARALEAVWRQGPLALYRMRGAAPCAAWQAEAEVEFVRDRAASVERLRASLGERPERLRVESDARAARPRPDAQGAPLAAALRWDGPNAIDVELPAAARDRDGWVLVRVSFDAGWSASGGGRALEIAPAELRFLAVRVPAGIPELRLRYRPPRLGAGVAIAATALALIALIAFAGRRGARRGSQTG